MEMVWNTKKTLAVGIAAILAAGMTLPTMHAAAESTVKKTYRYEELLDETGTFTISISGGRAIRVTIEEETLDNVILYYDTLLETDGTYAFVLDSCEYDNENTNAKGDYNSSYTITVTDENDSKCSYTEEGLIVMDPGFTTDVTASSYTWTVTSVEADSRSSTGKVTNPSLTDGIYAGSSAVTLNYLKYLLGDVDADGDVALQDAYLALQYYANQAANVSWSFSKAGVTKQSEDAAFAAADVDRDDAITITDASNILRYYANSAAGIDVSWDD